MYIFPKVAIFPKLSKKKKKMQTNGLHFCGTLEKRTDITFDKIWPQVRAAKVIIKLFSTSRLCNE